MNNTMWKLANVIKDYDWGTKTALFELFNIANTNNKPQAEIWMGVHPSGISTAIDAQGKQIKLDQLIAKNPVQILGEKTNNAYHTLPYLFKVLSAQEPLSIQVHPELSKAKQGYEKENQLGIALDSPKRNYKDPNHKPELVYALTPYWAMNGFRPITEIISLFTSLDIKTIKPEVNALTNNQTDDGLRTFFADLLTLDSTRKKQALLEFKSKIESLNHLPFNIIKEIAKSFPDDIGLFSALILNVIELQPGEAMFLKAQTPHAYLKGTGLEIMASSDNVLRAGLTSKYIDINELLDNTIFHSIAIEQLRTPPVIQNNKIDFPVPINDFAFEILNSNEQLQTEKTQSAEIIFCIEGEITLSTVTERFTIKAGESVFIAYCAGSFTYQGLGKLARAFNK
ncbi:mannose-6-phosphate isomerase, class I [Orbus wheelerorum]|uniref:mannose-6-phosphate isomerase, class I n=1 Tax=Orbus wheelerorum TaxID=3074111 RepID=UPI00370D599B